MLELALEVTPVVVIELSIGAVGLVILAAMYFRAARDKSRPQEPFSDDANDEPEV